MNTRKLLLYFSCFSLFIMLFAVSCKEDDPVVSSTKLVKDYPAEAILKWNKLFLRVERYAGGYRPGPAPRSEALMAFASYEACVTGMPEYNSIKSLYPAVHIPEVQAGAEYHWPTVIHNIYKTMMPLLFGDKDEPPADVRGEWNSLISELDAKYLAEAGEEVFNRSKDYGISVGTAVWEWSTTDTYGHQVYLNPFGNYNTNEDYDWNAHYDGDHSGDWHPTVPGPTSPMGPFYGKARTWVLNETEKLALPPSYYFMNYSEDPHSEYYAQALQAYTKNAASDYNVKWVGEFWSDDLFDLTFSPGPRWLAICDQIVEKDDVPLDKALEAYAKTGMAVADAAVAAWYSKFYYNVERPISYIQKVIDPNYKSNLNNPLNGFVGFVPPFPAYPSGHSTMGGAGAEALASVFGYSYAFTDNCHLGRTDFVGTPRTFTSLHEAALENAWSRVLLGTHWYMDCVEGVRLGTVIAQKVDALPWKK
ncbi:MAG TPA: vanadium-dependent haloperoxidase [Saprospiraceae bacterium]|nr:vanadium-dependent haloperoxidase [Saprospiraceae bacterium]